MSATETYKPGELFVYTNGNRWELGMVKRENNTGDGYFCWYSRGDTAASTPIRCMHKLANAGWTRIEQQLDELSERGELEAILDACEGSNLKHLSRIGKLERLCREMYKVISERNTWWDGTQGDKKAFGERMDALGVSIEEG